MVISGRNWFGIAGNPVSVFPNIGHIPISTGEYPLSDGRGSTRLTTDISKNILSTNVRDAFGRTISTAGSTANVYGYHGAEGYRSDGDGPAGGEPYQKVGARYYDATFERFITRDTDLSENAYQYCDGDPLNFSDPSGHKKKWWEFWKSDNYGPTVSVISKPGSAENQQTGALFQDVGNHLKITLLELVEQAVYIVKLQEHHLILLL